MEYKIYQVSALNGWDVTVETKGEVPCVNFQRMTVSGVHFTLTVEMRNNSTEWLADEILSFVDAFVPENYTAEWMKQTKTHSLVKFRQAVDDMKDIRMRAWSLACALSLSSKGSGIVPVFPLPPFLRQAGQLVGYQVCTEEYHPAIEQMPYERQWPFHVADIGINRTPVNA